MIIGIIIITSCLISITVIIIIISINNTNYCLICITSMIMMIIVMNIIIVIIIIVFCLILFHYCLFCVPQLRSHVVTTPNTRPRRVFPRSNYHACCSATLRWNLAGNFNSGCRRSKKHKIF